MNGSVLKKFLAKANRSSKSIWFFLIIFAIDSAYAGWEIPLCRNANFHPYYWTEEQAIEITWDSCPEIAKNRYRSGIWEVVRSGGITTRGACCRVWSSNESPCEPGETWHQSVQKCLSDDHCESQSEPAFSLNNRLCLTPNTPPNSGDPGCNGVGNPINFTTGAKYQREVDYLNSSLPMSIGISRSYNSDNPNGKIFGPYWSSAFDVSLVLNKQKTQAVVLLDDGKGETFSKIEDVWKSQNNVGSQLVNESGDWRYYDGSEFVYRFNSDGLVVEKVDANNRKWTYQYSDFGLSKVIDDYGKFVEFEYSSDGNVIKIATSSGDYVYEYVGGLLSGVTYPDLTPQSQTDNPARKYAYGYYDFPFLLRKITDEAGVIQSSWEYDQQGRAISTQRGLSEKYSISYSDVGVDQNKSVEVVNPLGKKTIYQYQEINGKNKVVHVDGVASANCAAANKSYDYCPDGTLKSKTDWSGNVTNYMRDELGREIVRVEAVGTPEEHIIKTEYHPALNLPVRIIESSRVQVMTYDEQGRLISKDIHSTISQAIQ